MYVVQFNPFITISFPGPSSESIRQSHFVSIYLSYAFDVGNVFLENRTEISVRLFVNTRITYFILDWKRTLDLHVLTDLLIVELKDQLNTEVRSPVNTNTSRVWILFFNLWDLVSLLDQGMWSEIAQGWDGRLKYH